MIVIKIYSGLNINELIFLGEGTQGKVYKIDSKKCIKIFKSKKICTAELYTLVMGQKDEHFPILYEYGNRYIIREYIDGIELDKYLSSNPLTPDISSKLIGLYEAMKKIGYSRLDSALFHIFLTPSEDIRLIDTARAMVNESTYPKLILSGLNDLGYRAEFLNHVKVFNPKLYNDWINHHK